MRDGRGTYRALVLGAVLGAWLSCLCMQGCNIVGGAAVAIAGPPKVQKLYDLDKSRPTVVLIDDFGSKLPNRTVRRLIGKTAEEVLANEVKVKTVIRSEDLLALIERQRFNAPLGVAEMGQSVGADVVVHVSMQEFGLTTDGQTFVPQAVARVKVIDAVAKKRLWPSGEGGMEEYYTLQVTAPQRQADPPRSMTEKSTADEQLAKRLGRAIGLMFVKHPERTPDGRIDQ